MFRISGRGIRSDSSVLKYSRLMSATGWKTAPPVPFGVGVRDFIFCIPSRFWYGILQQSGIGYKRRRLFFEEGIRINAYAVSGVCVSVYMQTGLVGKRRDFNKKFGIIIKAAI